MHTITRRNGQIEISPAPLGVSEVLTFEYKWKPKVEKKIFNRKTGQMMSIFVDGVVEKEDKELFFHDIGNDKVTTYIGMESRVIDWFYQSGMDYQIIDKTSMVGAPVLSNKIYDGLHSDQVLAAKKLLEYKYCNGGMIEAATNAGKTYIIAAICRAFAGQTGLIVTNRQTVAKRLYGSLKDLCPGNKIGIYIADTKKDGDMLIITAASLEKIDRNKISVIIFDEVHGASGEKRSQDIARFNRSYKYGLSATIENTFNGMHNYLEALFGPVVFRLTDKELEDMSRAAPLDIYVMNVDGGPASSSKMQDLTLEKKGIWYNKYRNKVLKECLDYIPSDQQALVFVRTEYHMNHLKEFFLKDFEIYHAKLPKKEKDRLLEGFNTGSIKRIISTDSLAEGVDPKALFVVANANWGQSDVSVSQKAGRNRRLADGKNRGIIIDFNDAWDPRYANKAKSRIQKYHNRGYTVIEPCSPKQIAQLFER